MIQSIILALLIAACAAFFLVGAKRRPPSSVAPKHRNRWLFINVVAVFVLIASAVSLGRFWAGC